jgi:hypothetical protein
METYLVRLGRRFSASQKIAGIAHHPRADERRDKKEASGVCQGHEKGRFCPKYIMVKDFNNFKQSLRPGCRRLMPPPFA